MRVVFDAEELLMTDRWQCLGCGLAIGEITPASLSWNSARGACERCQGRGERLRFDPARVVPDSSLSLSEGVIAPWGAPEGRYHARMLAELQSALKLDPDKPFRALPARTRERILNGDAKGYEGVLPGLERRLSEWGRKREGETGAEWLEDELAPFMQRDLCEACGGSRLAPHALAVRLADRNIHELSSLALEELRAFLDAHAWTAAEAPVAEPIVASCSRGSTCCSTWVSVI